MDGLSAELKESLRDLEPVLEKIADRSRHVRIEADQIDQLQAMSELRCSLDALNANLERIVPQRRSRWPWSQRGKA